MTRAVRCTSLGRRFGSVPWPFRPREWLTILGLLIITLVDPFSITSGSARLSEDVINRILSFSYPAPNRVSLLSSREPLARNKFLVVLLRDRDAEFINPGRGYPVPLVAHGDVLQLMLCQEPAAIFVDINFRWERSPGDAAALADALRHRRTDTGCETQRAGSPLLAKSPVLVAVVPSGSSTCEPMMPLPNPAAGAVPCAERDQFAPLREVMVPVAMPGTDDTRRYVLVDSDLQTAIPGSTSPAVELFRRVCDIDPQFGPGCRDRDRLLETLQSEVRATQIRPSLAVRWGFYASPPTHRDPSAASGCPDRQLNAGHPVSDFLRQLWTEVWRPGAGDVATKPDLSLGQAGWCAYHTTISATDLIELSSREPERLRDLVQGRIIVYGTDITAVHDDVASPVLGSLPGAHVHAMVADNLLSFGENYWRDPSWIVLGVGVNNWLVFALSVAAVLLGAYCCDVQKHIKATCRRYVLGWGYVILAIVVVMVMTLGLVIFGNWSPINCLGLFAASLTSRPKLLFVNETTGD